MNIALVAMSGIRACDPELLRLGLTLPGFVERSRAVASLPSLGLLTLASMTPERHRVTYLEMPDPGGFPRLDRGFDLVAISSYSAQIFEAYELARRCRARGMRVVIGGPHVSCLPEEALEHCDAVAVGEGESVWQRIVADCEGGRLAGVYGSCEGTFDLRYAPIPAYDLLDPRAYNRLTVQTSRGCPHRCEFCAGSVLLGGRYRQKPVGRVLEEIRRIARLWQRPFLEFADDNALVDPAYWAELLPRLEPLHLRWFAETDVSVGEDDELLRRMARSGCVQVLIGFESPVESDLAGLELRHDWKHRKWGRYREAIRRIQSHGISVNGCFVLGLDGQGPEIFDEVFDFVEASGLYEVQVTILTPFPGTPLYARLAAQQRILEPGRWDRCTLFDVSFRPARMSPEQLSRGFRELVVRLYGDEFTTVRRSRFKSTLREHARAVEEETHG